MLSFFDQLFYAFLISQECSVDVSKPDLTKKMSKRAVQMRGSQNGPSLNCKPVGQVTPDAGDLYGWQHVTSPLDAGILSVCEEKNGGMRGKVLHGGMQGIEEKGAKKRGVGLVPPHSSNIKLCQNGL